jgi:hypothetical protein
VCRFGAARTVIDRADPRMRVAVIAGMAVATIVGAVFISFADALRPAVIEWVMRDPAGSRSRAVAISIGLAAMVVLPVLGAAVYLWRFSVRVLRDRRFPPLGALLIVDTVVLEGAEAQQRGRLLRALAIGLGAMAVAFAFMFLRLILMMSAPR